MALAFKEVSTGAPLTETQAESDLSFLGITGMIDPPRPEAPPAIDKCQRAGIRIVMVTGDFGGTARAVAQEIGMHLVQRVPLLSGEQVSRMSDVQLRQILKRKGDVIFARTSPEEKLRIVAALQAPGGDRGGHRRRGE